MNRLSKVAFGIGLLLGPSLGVAVADFAATAGSGLTFFAFTCFTTKICATHVPVNSAGTEIGTSSNPIQVTGANGSFPASQSGTWNVGTVTNLAQMNGAALLMGNGVTGTGSQRVTIASDNTAFSVNATVVNANANGQATMANSSPVVIASNQSAIQVNETPTSSSTLALTDVVCGSASSSCVLKSSAGNLYGVYAECSAACWLMVFNATSAPSNGATTAGKASGNLVECISIPANDQRSLNYPTFPINLTVGITAMISSTTCATLTAATTGFIHGTVQ